MELCTLQCTVCEFVLHTTHIKSKNECTKKHEIHIIGVTGELLTRHLVLPGLEFPHILWRLVRIGRRICNIDIVISCVWVLADDPTSAGKWDHKGLCVDQGCAVGQFLHIRVHIGCRLAFSKDVRQLSTTV